MKRIWFGAALLIILLILGFCGSTLMERAHLEQSANLNRAAELAAAGNWTAAGSAFEEAKDHWEKIVPLVAALSDHEPMDQIEGFFGELEVFLKVQDAASFCSSCRYLAAQLDALGKSHSLNLQNLF